MSVFDDGPVHLDTPETMLAVLRELVGEDALKYRGVIDVWGEENPPGPAKWRLQLNDDSGHSETLMQGEYLAKVYGRLLKLTEREYLESQEN